MKAALANQGEIAWLLSASRQNLHRLSREKNQFQAKGGSNSAQIMKTTLVRGQRAEDAQFAIVVLAVE
jgi:hypothetical protein